MPDNLAQDRLDTYNELLEVADNLVLRLGPAKLTLTEHEDSAPRVWDEVDDVYVYGIHRGLGYREIQVLAALAVLDGSDFAVADDMLPPHDRSLDE